MNMKYVISSDGKDLAFSYNVPKREVMLGGPNTACSLAWSVMIDVFGVQSEQVATKSTSSGKTKYTFTLPVEEVHAGLRSLEESGVPVQQVSNFGRLVW